jgi:hypothetical protein
MNERGPEALGDNAAAADAERNVADYGLADRDVPDTAAVPGQAADALNAAAEEDDMPGLEAPAPSGARQAPPPPGPSPDGSPSPAAPAGGMRAAAVAALAAIWRAVIADTSDDIAEAEAKKKLEEAQKKVNAEVQANNALRGLNAQQLKNVQIEAARAGLAANKSPGMRRAIQESRVAFDGVVRQLFPDAPPAPPSPAGPAPAPPSPAPPAPAPAAAAPIIAASARELAASPVRAEGEVVSEGAQGNPNFIQKVKLNVQLNGRDLFLYSDNGIRFETLYKPGGQELQKALTPGQLKDARYSSGPKSGNKVDMTTDQLFVYYKDLKKGPTDKRQILWASFIAGKLKSKENPNVGVPRPGVNATPPNPDNTGQGYGSGMTNSPRKRSRFEKGSQEAKDHMAKLRDMRKKQKN